MDWSSYVRFLVVAAVAVAAVLLAWSSGGGATVTVEATDGGTVSGSGTYEEGARATVVAEPDRGYEFSGWYSGGELVSSSAEYTFKVSGDVELVGVFSVIRAFFDASQTSAAAPCDVSVSFDDDDGVEDRTVTWTDALTGEVLQTSRLGTGTRCSLHVEEMAVVIVESTVTFADGTTSSYSETVVADGEIVRTFSWLYRTEGGGDAGLNDSAGTLDVAMTLGWYWSYASADVPRDSNYAYVPDYVTGGDPVVTGIADGISRMTAGLSDLDRANCLLKFVQSLVYEYDSDAHGESNYWQFPAETLWLGTGDCEDFAFLFVSVAEAMGYDTVLHTLRNTTTFTYHMGAGIAVEGAEGVSTTVDGTDYLYCETGASGAGLISESRYNVGDFPDGYRLESTYTYTGGAVGYRRPRIRP